MKEELETYIRIRMYKSQKDRWRKIARSRNMTIKGVRSQKGCYNWTETNIIQLSHYIIQ